MFAFNPVWIFHVVTVLKTPYKWITYWMKHHSAVAVVDVPSSNRLFPSMLFFPALADGPGVPGDQVHDLAERRGGVSTTVSR